MTEPSADAIDEPIWEDTRGPHLPDRLTAIPILVWPFVALAVVQVIAIFRGDQGMDVWTFGRYALGFVGDLTTCLLGAALFLRHRDAVRTVPMLVAGVSLLAVGEVLRLVSASLEPVFEGMWPALDGATGLPMQAMLASAVFGQFVDVITLFGLLYLARGLDGARRFEGRTSRLAVAGLVLLAAISTAVLTNAYIGVPEGGILGGPAFIALAVGIFGATSLATAYVVAVTLAGWRAGEEPSTSWALAVVWGLVTMIGTAVYLVAAVRQVGTIDLLSTLFATTTAIAGVLLLSAFLLGLPSTERIEWVDVETDDLGPDADLESDDDAEPSDDLEPEPTLDPPAATTPGSAGS